jgi:phosphatidylglycerol:prolipoprotein diacylglycerol transferase
MFPQLFKFGSFALPTYGILIATGFASAIWISMRIAPSEGVSKEKIYNLGIYLAIAGMLGAKLFLIFQDRAYYLQNPRDLFSLSTLQSGGIFYGGLLTGIAAAFWCAYKYAIPFIKLGDIFAPGIALGHAFGRLGCFAAGCCWGEPTSLPWGVTYTSAYAHEVVGVPLGISLHPTQLYESFAAFIIFGILYKNYRRKRFDGQILGWYLLMYPTVRFLVEFVRRHDDAAWFATGLSEAQAASLLLIGAAIWLLWLGPYRRRAVGSSANTSPHDTIPSARGAASL